MSPDTHVFVPVPHQTGCATCGYARGHHPTARMLRERPPIVHAFDFRGQALCGSSNHEDGDAPASHDITEITCPECHHKLLATTDDTYQTSEHCQYCDNSWQQTRTVGTPRLDAVPCPACRRLV